MCCGNNKQVNDLGQYNILIKKKVSNKRQSQTNDDEDTYLKEAIDIMKKPKIDFDRFGDYDAFNF